MKDRTMLVRMLVVAVMLILIGLLSGTALGGVDLQPAPTAQQQTIHAVVSDYFTQTAQAEQQLVATPTMAPTLSHQLTATAAFRATVDRSFQQALTSTAVVRPIAMVNGQPLSIETFQARIRFARWQYASQIRQLYELTGGDIWLIEQYAGEQLSDLQFPDSMGSKRLDQMEEDLIIAQGAAKLGITVDEAAVDEQIRLSMAAQAGLSLPSDEMPPPTHMPTPTLLVSFTPTPLAEQTPTMTPSATATLDRTQLEATLQQTTDDFYTDAAAQGLSHSTLRMEFYYQALRQAVHDELAKSIPTEELQVNARYILISFDPENVGNITPPTSEQKTVALNRAEAVLAALRNGEPFADLARSTSDDMASAEQGGELSWANPDEFVDPFKVAVLKADIGEIVGPVETEFGYFIIQVLGRDIRPLTEAELNRRQWQAYEDWLDAEKASTTIIRRDDWMDYIPDTPTYDDLLGDILPSESAINATATYEAGPYAVAQTATAESITPVPLLEIVLVPAIPIELVTQEQMQATANVIQSRLQTLGVNDISMQVSEARITIQLKNVRETQRIVAAATQIGLLEFVDFSMVVQGQIPDGACILTTEQVKLAEARLPEDTPPPAYTDYSCASQDPGGTPEPALTNNGQPYQTIMTSSGMADAVAMPQGVIGTSWVVSFTLREDGDRVQDLLDYVADNANHPMAIVLDGRLLAYPTIQSDLAASAAAGTMDSGIISGNFTKDEAQVLAAQIMSTMLPVPLQVESMGPIIQ